VRAEEVLADYTVLYGDDKRRINRTMLDNSEVREAKNKGQQMHLDLLRKLIPDASAKWR
jgi:dynactin-6